MATIERRNSRSRLLASLVLVAMALLVARHLLGWFGQSESAWYIADTLRAAALAVVFSICTIVTPWKMLQVKCLLAAMAAYYVSDAILCALWYWVGWPDFLLSTTIQGATFLIAALVYLRRSYDRPSDPLSPGYLYSVRKIPGNTQDFLISLAAVYGPDGSYALYADGYLYKFIAGRMVRRRVSYLPPAIYHVEQGSKLTPQLIEKLDSLVGSRWSIKANCLTVLGGIWRKHSGRPY